MTFVVVVVVVVFVMVVVVVCLLSLCPAWLLGGTLVSDNK